MNKKQSFKIFCLTCAGMLMLASPVYAQWPTLDLSQVTNMINGWTSQIESTSSTIQSTLSVGNIQQALGDSLGSLSKFTDAKEKAEKLAEKVEKQKKRAERLVELKKKFDEQVENAKQFADNVKSEVGNVVDAGKNLYEEGKSVYDEGKALYEEGKDTIGAAQDMISGGMAVAGIGGGNNTPENTEELIAEEEIMDSEALDDEAIADLISDEEFSEGSWSGEAGYFGTETEDSESGLGIRSPTISDGTLSVEEETLIGRQPFVNEKLKTDTTAMNNQSSEAASTVLPTKGPSAVRSAISGEATEIPSATAEITGIDGVALEESPASAPVGKTPVRRAFTAPQAVTDTVPAGMIAGETTAGKAVVQPAVNSVSSAGSADLKSSPVSITTPVSSAPEIKTTPVRRAFTTSSAGFLYQSSRPMAFAQVASATFKTGTNDDGKFIYSDIIANKCGINFDEVDEEKVIACVKTWVLGMNDANAETATDWKNEYNKAKRDHVAADLAMALTQKNYSASFSSEVADDLDSKSEALTNEREEISFVGKVAQTNQEVIIRLMEAMTGQAITDAWSAIGIMDKDYYDGEDADE